MITQLLETSRLNWAQWRRQHLESWQQVSWGKIQVHYKPHLDGGGSSFGQLFIPFLHDCQMPRQGRVFEWCAGPGFIGFSMLDQGLCESLCVADINERAVRACRRTVRYNGLQERVSVYHSDGLKAIPSSERWDLVVSNPPHFCDLYPGSLLRHDPDWQAHRQFFASVSTFLKPGGVIVLQENSRGSTVDSFRKMIEHSGLRVAFVRHGTPRRTDDNHLYFILVARRNDALPDWVHRLSG